MIDPLERRRNGVFNYTAMKTSRLAMYFELLYWTEVSIWIALIFRFLCYWCTMWRNRIAVQTLLDLTSFQITQFKTYAILSIFLKCSHYRPGVAQRVGRGIALLFHDRGTRREWMVSSTPRPHFTPGKDPVPILQEAGWAPGPVWTGGKSRPHRDSITDLQPVVSRYTDWATRSTF